MTFVEYMDWSRELTRQIQEIADRTGQMALVGSANPSNPMFVDLMRRREHLVRQDAELTERMMREMGIIQ